MLALLGEAASKFMNKVGNKMFKDFSKKELMQYEKIQTKYLKQRIESQTGAKVSQRQLKREVSKMVNEWKNLKVSEIDALKFTTVKAVKSGAEITVTLETKEVSKNSTK